MASLHDRSLFFSSNAIPPFRAFAKVIIGGETDTGVVAMRCPLVCGSPVAKFSCIESSCRNILLLAMGAFFFFFFFCFRGSRLLVGFASAGLSMLLLVARNLRTVCLEHHFRSGPPVFKFFTFFLLPRCSPVLYLSVVALCLFAVKISLNGRHRAGCMQAVCILFYHCFAFL